MKDQIVIHLRLFHAPHMSFRLIMLAVSLSLLGLCGGLSVTGQARTVHNEGALLLDRGPVLQLETEIGQSGPPEALLGSPTTWLVWGGEVFVTDERESCIKIYDLMGTYLRRIGNKGGGPGEFNVPAGTHVSPDDELVVFDPFNRRISRFSREGEFLGSERTDDLSLGTVPLLLPDGDYLMSKEGGFVITRFDRSGRPEQEGLLRVVGPDWQTRRWLGGMKRPDDRQLFTILNHVQVDVDDDGTVVVGYVYLNEIRILDGVTGELRLIMDRELEFEPRELERPGRRPAPSGEGSGFRMTRPEVDEVTLDVALDGTGRLWTITRRVPESQVEELLAEASYRDLQQLEVFDLTGRLLARIPLDYAASKLSFDDEGRLWMMDADQTATLRQYRVVWP
jgi:hypothetical protein